MVVPCQPARMPNFDTYAFFLNFMPGSSPFVNSTPPLFIVLAGIVFDQDNVSVARVVGYQRLC